jgi:hypothetical protein
MIRPWYRSWLFWFGLPGLAMLWWLWLDTPARHFEVKVMGGNSCLRVADSSRLLEIGWTRDSTLYLPSKVEVIHLMRTEDRLFPPALWLSSYGGEHDQVRKWFVAYWLLILGYLPLWLGSVAWWQRRKERLLKASAAAMLTAPPPSAPSTSILRTSSPRFPR